MAAEGYHEPLEQLGEHTRDMHRAIRSLMEELEAVDWYNQRRDASSDPELQAILQHNADEEKEHAAMLLEWIRRRDPVLDAELRNTLFKDGPIGQHADDGEGARPVAEAAEVAEVVDTHHGPPPTARSIAIDTQRPTIGSLRGVPQPNAND